MNTQFVELLVQNRLGGVKILSLESLENAGGFSGARIWKAETETGTFCVRRWPRPHPSKDRLEFIHGVLLHLESNNYELIAPPIRAQTGETWAEFGGYFWELNKWLPGKANFWLDSNDVKLRNAVVALSRLHEICRRTSMWKTRAESPGILYRMRRLREINSSYIQCLERSIDKNPGADFGSTCHQRISELCRWIVAASGKLADSCLAQISGFDGKYNLSPCLRDIWHDHVLFTENRVTGIIDYGALDIDAPAGDFARLLGSLASDDQNHWDIGCVAIEQSFPEIADQIPMIRAIDFANVVLAGLNWANWIYKEKREFPIQADVLARLEHIQRRLNARIR